jgi:hypothetical protein
MQRLPIGISEFRELIETNCVYVDKTKQVYSLLTNNRRTFLSRPRRFGKSLLVSTLAAALKGDKHLFKGLWIAGSDYSWKPTGIIRLDFSGFSVESIKECKESFLDQLISIMEFENIVPKKTTNAHILFRYLIQELYKKYTSVAILIDEYDYPILQTVHKPKKALAIRELMKGFSSVIKAQSEFVSFVFVTGVSAFSKSGLSSGLNNLKNLTMLEDFFDICGYTEKEIDTYFTNYIEEWAALREAPYEEVKKELKAWYNGYRFSENTPTIYSPFSFTCALDIKKIQNFWFESATPQFLLEEIAKAERQEECRFLSQDEFYGSMGVLQTFEIEHIPLIALLFQMGYVTIDAYESKDKMYRLKYPNLEVKTALNKHLLVSLTKIAPSPFDSLVVQLFSALEQENLEELIHIIQRIFSKIPYQLQQQSEKFYHSILQSLFVAADITSHAEYSTSLGRADILLELPNIFYILEIKVGQPPEKALEQIESRKYYESFMHQKKHIRLLGISFIQFKNSGLSIEYATKRL